MVFLDESPKITRSFSQAHANDDDNDNNIDEGMDWNINSEICKETLRSRILKGSESMWEKGESDLGMVSPKKIQSDNGLFTVPRRLSVSTCPALQVIAHNTVVSNAKIGIMRKVEPFHPMKRAVKAFKAGWREVNSRLSIVPASLYRVPSKPGLRHIQNLFFFADNLNRNKNNVLASNDRAFWKNFYLKPCKQMKGSIVMELYPDFYGRDENAGTAFPYYSQENIKGAVDAATELCSQKRSDGHEPVSFMFVERDQKIAEALGKEIKGREIALSNGKEAKNHSTESVRGKEDKYLALSGMDELLIINKRLEEKKGCDNISPEKEYVNRELCAARDRRRKASAEKKVQEITERASKLQKEDLATVLSNLDQNILYESLNLVKSGTSDKNTPPKPFKPVAPDNLPTPGTNALKLGVRQAMDRRKENFEKGSMPRLINGALNDD